MRQIGVDCVVPETEAKVREMLRAPASLDVPAEIRKAMVSGNLADKNAALGAALAEIYRLKYPMMMPNAPARP